MEKNQHTQGHKQEEVLEISSTGYGFESSKKENEDKSNQKERDFSCGGL